MLGAIIGDITGSVFEYHNIKTKDFSLFGDASFFQMIQIKEYIERKHG